MLIILSHRFFEILTVSLFTLVILVSANASAHSIALSSYDRFQSVQNDTIPAVAHPDSIPYSVSTSFGRKVARLPATLLNTAILPLEWSVIYIEENNLIPRVSDIFLNEDGTAGFYPNFSVGGRTGFAAGITYFNRDVFNHGHSLDLNTFYTNTHNFNLGMNYIVPPGEESRFQFDIRANLRFNDDQDIFLGGNDGRENLEVDYAIERYDLQSELGYLIRSNLLMSFRSGFKHTAVKGLSEVTETGEPIDNFINTDKFAVGIVNLATVGLSATFDRRGAVGQNRNSNLISAITSSYDFKQSKTRIFSGFLVDAGLAYNRSVDSSEFEFLNYYGEGQYFIPLPGLPLNRRLAMRARLEKRYQLGNAPVPFYEQSILGDAQNLRGYEQDRFRDLGSLLFTLEYRYPIWDTWDAVVFTDQGQVFNQFSQLSFNRFQSSIGTGLRFMTASDFLFRIEIAFSDESTQTLLEFSMNF